MEATMHPFSTVRGKESVRALQADGKKLLPLRKDIISTELAKGLTEDNKACAAKFGRKNSRPTLQKDVTFRDLKDTEPSTCMQHST